jgi:hypothetical protein
MKLLVFFVSSCCFVGPLLGESPANSAKHESSRIQTIQRSCVVKKEEWEPFDYVLETRDGMRIPMGGGFPPLEKSGKNVINLPDSKFTILIRRYDLREYYRRKREHEKRLEKKHGKPMPVSGISGIPDDDFGWFVTISKVEIEGKVFGSSGNLEKLGIIPADH